MTWLIDKLGALLFPRLDWYERRMKAWRVVLSVAGAIVLAGLVTYVTMEVSETGFALGNARSRNAVQDLGH